MAQDLPPPSKPVQPPPQRPRARCLVLGLLIVAVAAARVAVTAIESPVW